MWLVTLFIILCLLGLGMFITTLILLSHFWKTWLAIEKEKEELYR